LCRTRAIFELVVCTFDSEPEACHEHHLDRRHQHRHHLSHRVIPHELLDQNIPEYLRQRIAMQDEHMGTMRATLGDQVLAQAPEMERDVTGLAMIEKLADKMFA